MHDEAEEADADDGGGGGNAQGVPLENPLVTTHLRTDHRVADFQCAKSDRVRTFLLGEAQRLIKANYCRVFVLQDPGNPTAIHGFYSLSAALIVRDETSNRHQRKSPKGLPVPLVRIGYMGRDDGCGGQNLGPMLLHDAALRVLLNPDIAAWGLMLNPENAKLAEWYKKAGFDPCKKKEGEHEMMYAPLFALLTEEEMNLCPVPACEYIAEKLPA